jgi:hypothetical protein
MNDFDHLQNDHLQVKDENENLKKERIYNRVALTFIGLGLVLLWFLLYRFQLLR